MKIKKSTLEKKWYYRVAKVVFLSLPWVFLIVIFFKIGLITSDILSKNIILILQENKNTILFAIFGLIIYFVFLKIIWRIFLYIFFGGIEDDLAPKSTGVVSEKADQVTTVTGLPTEDKKQIGFYLFLLFIIAIIYYAYFIWTPSNIINNNGGAKGKNSKCISTGCGSQWHCFGSYYEDGVQKRINGCLPRKAGEIYSSWSGTCRQCP